MFDKLNNEEKIDSNLVLTVKILQQNKIPYWFCHGTLLGVIRDKKLIESDQDIDIAIWDNVVSKKKLIEVMTLNNFKMKTQFFIGDGLLRFCKTGGRDVDVNFYQIIYNKVTNKNMAVVYSAYIPKNIYMKFIDAMSMARKYSGKFKYIIRMFCIFEPFFKFIKLKLIKNNIFYKSVGYCEPLELLKEFKEVNFFDIKLTVPYKSEELLKYIYGDDWRIPKKNYYYAEVHKNNPSTLIGT